MKIRDLHTQLHTDVNIQGFYSESEIEVDTIINRNHSIVDIYEDLPNTINCDSNKSIIIKKLQNKGGVSDALGPKNTVPFIYNKGVQTLEYGKKHVISQIKSFNLKKAQKPKYKVIKQFLYTITLLFVIIFFMKIGVVHYTESGYKKLLNLDKSNKDCDEACQNTSILHIVGEAKRDFQIARALLFPFTIIPSKDIKNAELLISGGKKLSHLIYDFVSIGNSIKTLSIHKGIDNILFSQLLLNHKNTFIESEKTLSKIYNIYSQLDLSGENKFLKFKVSRALQLVKKTQYYNHILNNNFDTLLEIMGHNKRKKYLIVFQNNDEIRPQGGFMGSLAIVEIFRGNIKKIAKNDVYFYEFKLKKSNVQKILAPKGISKLTSYLGLRDANYYINNRDSSEKIKKFMIDAGYPIDGILYINKNSLIEILELLGEFKSEVLDEQINQNNFSLIMSLLVEKKISKKGTLGTPKKILFDFMDEIKTIVTVENISSSKIVKSLLNGIQQRESNFYLFNKKERNLLQNLSLYNEIDFKEPFDFSYPVFTSISGNKSDRYIKTNYIKKVKTLKNCSIETSLNITLHHSFDLEEEKKILNYSQKYNLTYHKSNTIEHMLSIQGKGQNQQYVRVIVPKEANIKNTNVGITEYNNRGKSLDFYMNTNPGESTNVLITYSLDNPSCLIYNFTLYKQPGIPHYSITTTVDGKSDSFSDIKKDFIYYK